MEKLKSRVEKLRNEKEFKLDEKKKIGDDNYNLKNIKLRSYQKDGIKWLIERNEMDIGCILADEMGLGKTCQTIGLCVYVVNRSYKKDENCKILILSPLSVLNNWSSELDKFAPELTYVSYMGDKEARTDLHKKVKDKKTNIVLCTYELLMKDEYVFSHVDWNLLIVDEGHRLKNSNSLLYRCLNELNIDQRVLLTGTPIQNNLNELYSLLRFVQPNVFKLKYEDDFVETFTDTTDNIKELTWLLQPFVLRRMKSQVNIDLPERAEVILYHGLTKLQKSLYKAILAKDIDAFKNSKKVRLNNILMHLRKICCHPYMVPGVEPEPFELGEHLIETSGKFLLLDSLLKYLAKNGHKVLIFSQFTSVLDIVQDYLGYRDYNYERLDGSVRGEERNIAIKKFNKDTETFVFLLSTKAGGVGLNLVSADTCIFLDNDFNPQNDLQAAARAHRIGQTRPVMIIRFVGKSTVEEIIFKRAISKLKLSNEIMESGELANTLDASAIEIIDIIKYGLDTLFENEDSTTEDENAIDFETLLAPSKDNKWVIKKVDKKVETKDEGKKAEKEKEEKKEAPKTMYEFEGKDYSKELCSDKDKEKFELILKTNTTLMNKKEEEDEEPTRKKREIVKLSDEEIAARAEKRKLQMEQSKEAKRQKLEEQKKHKEEKLKEKWQKSGYISAKLIHDVEEKQAEEGQDEDERISTLDLLENEDVDTKYLHYVKGDVTMPRYAMDKNAIIVHCVDNSGSWGRGGLFDAISRRSKLAARQYKLAYEMDDLKFGDVHLVEIDDVKRRESVNDFVALIVAQKRDKSGNLSSIDMKAIENGFNQIYYSAKEIGATVHMPRIGYNTPGFNWYGIEKLIKKCFVSRKMSSYIYYFDRRAATHKQKDDGDDEVMEVDEKIEKSESEDEYVSIKKKNEPETLDEKMEVLNDILPNLFSNMNIYFYSTRASDVNSELISFDQVKRYIIAYDGSIDTTANSQTTHIIVNKTDLDKLKNEDFVRNNCKDALIVDYDWIQNCVLRKTHVKVDKYKYEI